MLENGENSSLLVAATMASVELDAHHAFGQEFLLQQDDPPVVDANSVSSPDSSFLWNNVCPSAYDGIGADELVRQASDLPDFQS